LILHVDDLHEQMWQAELFINYTPVPRIIDVFEWDSTEELGAETEGNPTSRQLKLLLLIHSATVAPATL
jgi:hypothetical protein